MPVAAFRTSDSEYVLDVYFSVTMAVEGTAENNGVVIGQSDGVMSFDIKNTDCLEAINHDRGAFAYAQIRLSYNWYRQFQIVSVDTGISLEKRDVVNNENRVWIDYNPCADMA